MRLVRRLCDRCGNPFEGVSTRYNCVNCAHEIIKYKARERTRKMRGKSTNWRLERIKNMQVRERKACMCVGSYRCPEHA